MPSPAKAGLCPAAAEICNVIIDLAGTVLAGDVQGVLSMAAPTLLTCSEIPENDEWACFGAQRGDVRPAYSEVQAGEGSWVNAQRFDVAVRDALSGLGRAGRDGASLRDTYGPGDARVAAIDCFRGGADPEPCSTAYVRVLFTAIDPLRPANFQRIVACFTLREVEGELAVTGLGCAIPPYMGLYGFSHPGSLADGHSGTFEYFPWSPVIR